MDGVEIETTGVIGPKEAQVTALGKPAIRSVAGVVLAGGASRRMGQPKAGLRLGGSTLLERQLATLADVGADPLLVSTRPGIPLPPLPAGLRVSVVEDDWPDAGPLAGIERALRAVPTRWLVVLAVDLPGMTSAWLSGLLQGLRPGVGRIPRRDGRWEPLAAVYPVHRAAPESRFLLAGRRLRLQEWIDGAVDDGWMEPVEVGADAGSALVNWNRPGEGPTAAIGGR